VADQLSHKRDSYEDQDNERKKHQARPLAAPDESDGCDYARARAKQDTDEAHQREPLVRVAQDSENERRQEERRERYQEPGRPRVKRRARRQNPWLVRACRRGFHGIAVLYTRASRRVRANLSRGVPGGGASYPDVEPF